MITEEVFRVPGMRDGKLDHNGTVGKKQGKWIWDCLREVGKD